jgi:hypothetical protein
MKRRGLGAIALALTGITAAGSGIASDHQDSPSGSSDPTADLTDVFAFASPEDPDRLVLAMNVHAGAFSDARFSDAVVYSFRVREEGDDDRELRIDCSFDDDDDQRGQCTAYAFDVETGKLRQKTGGRTFAVGEVADEDDGMRIFAGLRADPFYIDAAGAPSGIRGGAFSFTGQNALENRDVLSIVVELDVPDVFDGYGGDGKLRVSAEVTAEVER